MRNIKFLNTYLLAKIYTTDASTNRWSYGCKATNTFYYQLIKSYNNYNTVDLTNCNKELYTISLCVCSLTKKSDLLKCHSSGVTAELRGDHLQMKEA